jgi:hypothetical protein
VTETLLWEDVLVPGPDDPDWNDVVRRAARTRRRRFAVTALAVAAISCLGIAAAYALDHPIVDFSSAPKGPTKVVNDFGSLEVGAPDGMAPGVLPHEARRITTVTIDGKEHVLWVAPTKKGGFCEQWSDLTGGCRADRHDRFAERIDVTYGGTGPDFLSGSFFENAADKLELAYADGTTDEIPFVWVTAPIDAGFYLFRVPDAHRVDEHRPTEMRLYDAGGKLLRSQRLEHLSPYVLSLNTHRLPGYPLLSVPREAIWEQRRQLFDLRADDGDRIGLWVAPSRSGGTCMWTNQAFGCTRAGEESKEPTIGLGFSGATTHVTLCCTVGQDVARVEARFEDGDRIDLPPPKEGYLVWPVPARHYPLGQRLEELVAFDSSGHELATQQFETNAKGLYPCSKPKQLGYGVSMCP